MADPIMFDDKSEHCVPFILENLERHRKETRAPFFIGVNGVQGVGKTTLVNALQKTLSSPPYDLPTVVLSIDDLYLRHEDQLQLAASHQSNPLVQHRGEPGTHDLNLARAVFKALSDHEQVKIPCYDKSAFNGKGDRFLESTWQEVNSPGARSVEAVVFEGWCVGFRALSEAQLRQSWESAKQQAECEVKQGSKPTGSLWSHTWENIKQINDALKEYDVLTGYLNAFVHLDAEETAFVYGWRLEQEVALRAARGSGMTDEQVFTFVNGYYPAYELYTSSLREGLREDMPGRQLRLVIGKDRKVKSVIRL